ncbi:MAG: adenosylmethionine--8-amino-7-oxononanoate transaminase [Candidatus Omnitrophica bacterium]|nr:adenosylmethionine--8-amino-7-oxononanoate transaminase [Candidatus Omnitrophota bacterium]
MRDWQAEEILVIEKAKGVYLEDSHGRRYLDGISSLWCNVHGHQVSVIDRAIRDQLKRVAHSTFLGLSNPPAIELAEQLIHRAPAGLTRVFYSDSGSEAVEVAVKMAFQYWQHRGHPKKVKFARLTNAYHGDTLGAVSLGGIDLFHHLFQPLLFDTYAVPSPYRYRWPSGDDPERVKDEALSAMERVLSEHHEELAAFVMETLMQGAAGMIDQPVGYISRARELTKRYNTLLIFDEVATGFGRTGKMFACDHEGVTPDLLAVAKGLSGGYLPLAATLATEEIYEAFLGGYADCKTFFHGHTYTANPLACRAAIASLELFDKNQVLKRLQPKIAFLKKRLRDFYDIPTVGDIRQVGFMVGIELVKDKKTKTPFPLAQKIGIRVIEKAREKGAILRPLGPVIVLMPPLAMKERELSQLLDITYASIAEATIKN